MPIDDEIVVGGIFVLADAGLDQGRIFHSRKTIGKIAAGLSEAIFAHQPLAGGWIELRPARVIGHFEAASLVSRNSVHEVVAVIGPHRYVALVVARIARGSA